MGRNQRSWYDSLVVLRIGAVLLLFLLVYLALQRQILPAVLSLGTFVIVCIGSRTPRRKMAGAFIQAKPSPKMESQEGQTLQLKQEVAHELNLSLVQWTRASCALERELSLRDIAKRLQTTTTCVSSTLSKVYGKVGVSNRSQFVALAMDRGWIQIVQELDPLEEGDQA